MTIAEDQHKTFVGKILQSIGHFFAHLLDGAKKTWNELPKEQQDAIVKGVNVSQIIKEGYAKGEAFVLSEIEAKTGVPADVATALILSIAKDSGVNVTSVQAYLDTLANKVQSGLTDNHWNSLWQTVAQFGASYLSNGSLNWTSLAIGLVEFAFQTFVKK